MPAPTTIFLFPENDGGFTVIAPDFPGCITNGDTIEEALRMMGEEE